MNGQGWARPQQQQQRRTAVLYAHGGGFVAVKSAHLRHSITPLVRCGFDVYSIDYPLAPEDPFPAALVSTVRALAMLHREYGVREVVLSEPRGHRLHVSKIGPERGSRGTAGTPAHGQRMLHTGHSTQDTHTRNVFVTMAVLSG